MTGFGGAALMKRRKNQPILSTQLLLVLS